MRYGFQKIIVFARGRSIQRDEQDIGLAQAKLDTYKPLMVAWENWYLCVDILVPANGAAMSDRAFVEKFVLIIDKHVWSSYLESKVWEMFIKASLVMIRQPYLL